jgi:hypothetical protein
MTAPIAVPYDNLVYMGLLYGGYKE